MQLYSLTEKGYLRRIKNVHFLETAVYLIDDEKTIYLWLGKNISKNKKLKCIERAEKLNSEKIDVALVQIINQDNEYGSFISIMNSLGKKEEEGSIKNREELIIEFDDTMELIDAGLDPDLEAEITLIAHKYSKENLSYEELCNKLAKLQLQIQKGSEKYSQKELESKIQEIFKSSSSYKELCWLISELEILIEKNILD
ncbi:MAG: hypothetical protein KGD63_08520 [Candidatus Lokiarchaeota archaeon]|nr:hypothetical protein [Candidatus Lokiarchaeota archaeon]